MNVKSMQASIRDSEWSVVDVAYQHGPSPVQVVPPKGTNPSSFVSGGRVLFINATDKAAMANSGRLVPSLCPIAAAWIKEIWARKVGSAMEAAQ